MRILVNFMLRQMDQSIHSQVDDLDQDTGSPAPSSKKRKHGLSGRGVASLTPEQLAKKRANDREAQRAIRERTKATIENLERRIQELTSQQPYQELQAVIRQKDAIQTENEEIRRRLASIMSIIQPIVGAQGLAGDLATAASHNVQMGFASQSNNVFQQDQYLANAQSNRAYPPPGIAQDGSSYPAPFGASDQDQTADNRAWSSSRDALNQQRDNLHRSLELNESGERLSFNFLLDGINSQQGSKMAQQSAMPGSLDSPTNRQNFPLNQDSTQPVYTMLPKNCAPTCPLDSVLLDFLRDRKREAAASHASPNTVPPAYPSVSSLLNPASTTTIDPLSQLMTDIITKFPNISGLPEQVAILFTMFLFMRWQIYPTQENYERLPEWITPRPSQLFTPHPAWIDHLFFPRMRDKVIANYRDYPFENWFLPFTSEMSVNWPYEPVDCLLSTDMSGSSSGDGSVESGATSGVGGGGGAAVGASMLTTINPVFERHIRRIENWSLGPQFAEAFPALADTATIRSRNTAVPHQALIPTPRRNGS